MSTRPVSETNAVFSPEITAHFSNHLVGLGMEYSSQDERQFTVMSGFALEIGDIWLWVTAGHCLDEIEQIQAKGAMHRCRFLDGFGTKPVTREALPVEISACCEWHLYDDQTGIDVGCLVLRDLYTDGLRANGIVPMRLDDWRNQQQEFDGYCLCGVIAKWTDVTLASFEVRNAFFPVFETAAAPDVLKKPFPRFYANVPNFENLPSIKGMSGGPIFGFKKLPDGQVRYWISAIQNGWDRKSRVLAACPVTLFGAILERAVMQHSSPS